MWAAQFITCFELSNEATQMWAGPFVTSVGPSKSVIKMYLTVGISGRNKNGHFIYIETSYPRRRGQKALLLVKLEGKSLCMHFWYHMYGSGIGSLKIMRVIKNIDDDKIPAATDFTSIEWQKQGNQGNRWMMAEQDLLVDRKFKRHFIHWVS